MKAFQHVNARDIQHAVSALKTPGAVAIGGGTDLLTELKKRIRSAQTVVNLKTVPGLDQVQEADGAVRIGALATIDRIATDAIVRNRFPALSRAAETIGSPQIRNAGTVGGNLCQRVRCWYYRSPEVACWLKGGKTCYARKGVNRYHAVLGQCPCVAVNPSDLAPVLMALDASVFIAGSDPDRKLSMASFYRLPEADRRHQTVLPPDAVIHEVVVPIRPDDSTGVYLKAMERAAWSFALVGAAVQVDWTGDTVQNAAIVLGGMAGIPWRAEAAEKVLRGRRIDPETARAASEAAVSDARPLQWNVYKVPMVKNLLQKALLTLATGK